MREDPIAGVDVEVSDPSRPSRELNNGCPRKHALQSGLSRDLARLLDRAFRNRVAVVDTRSEDVTARYPRRRLPSDDVRPCGCDVVAGVEAPVDLDVRVTDLWELGNTRYRGVTLRRSRSRSAAPLPSGPRVRLWQRAPAPPQALRLRPCLTPRRSRSRPLRTGRRRTATSTRTHTRHRACGSHTPPTAGALCVTALST
jgi:hypothetical protein